VIVSVVPTKLDGKVRSDEDAGPLITAPDVLYCDPWHGHSYTEFWKLVTVHPSCVQMAVSTVNPLAPVRETRNARPDAFTSAALPAAASGELASIVSVMVLLTMLLEMVGIPGSVLTLPDDDVGLPPQPVRIDATAASDSV
jgi:hypothetical protein